ncbi:efflux RND transporter periplasmic adaptor subunit [Marivita sp. XM-24bin2]|jgi:RND family efflux transporter MFP subunit|uniref:efflux RND transporter periplasmic adaptor subunit n=1 Tax=unclassified Marivita TaxID=2632480 RepID=UPI000D7AED89|nr:efflux RND transporter periplasmic adaptor subunit [Marivita sp. XM-24bin2]MCR9108818.1 efflux RND transporter periplasmic adaptor subunit [Paracoccaceae bacterium]PWL34053.1 MAG: efflux RND transporter periplasmic adaptor subunit [Marivita sp. XM-24bin2]
MGRLFVLLLLVLSPFAALAQDMRLAKIIEVQSSDSAVTRQFFGHVVAKETVDLAFQVGGQIVELPVIEGARIDEGTMVAQLDLEPFELALDQARVQRNQAERTLDRLQKLQGSTVSQVSVDDAETSLRLAEIAVRNAERELNNATLLAPFDALVASRNVANYATISAGTPIVRLHDMSDLRIEIDVPEVLFQRAGTDPNLELWAQFPTDDARYPVTPREFNAETSQVGQTYQITLGMTPPEDRTVLPGSSVTVYATLNSETQDIVIPASAVSTANDGSTSVMVFTPTGADEGTVARRPVTVEPTIRGNVRVTEGLKPGQEIVASGASQLADGDRVKRFTGFSN